jgi:hypothetical protein
MPKSTQYNEMFHIWFFSVLSAFAGCFIMYRVSSETFEPAYAGIGIAHLIIFLPAMLYTEQRWYNIVTASVLCVLFPIWGGFVGLITVGIAAPIVCSMIWGAVLVAALRRPMAFPVLLVVGIVSNAILFFPVEVASGKYGVNIEEQLVTSYYAWYVSMLFAMPIIMQYKITTPPPKNAGEDICDSCGYSFEGLDAQSVCPECGTVRAA